jgi:hypothetical protein
VGSLRSTIGLRCNAYQRDAELKNCICRNNPTNTFISVPEMRSDAKPALASDAHSLHSILEPRNHPPLTEPKRTRLVFLDPVATVKKEVVSNIHDTTYLGRRPLTEHEILVFDPTPTSVHLFVAQRQA